LFALILTFSLMEKELVLLQAKAVKSTSHVVQVFLSPRERGV
jgi:hypothetical protein